MWRAAFPEDGSSGVVARPRSLTVAGAAQASTCFPILLRRQSPSQAPRTVSPRSNRKRRPGDFTGLAMLRGNIGDSLNKISAVAGCCSKF